MAAQLPAVAQPAEVLAHVGPQDHDALRQELRAQQVGMQKSALGQLVSAQHLREPKVVFDSGALTCLVTNVLWLKKQRV